jgi:CHAT domain-containing protein
MVELLVEQKRFPDALAYAERAKGRVLLDVLRNGREDITKAMNSDELAQERRLEAVIRALDARLRQENAQSPPNAGLAAGLASQLKAARLQYEAFQTTLYSVHRDLKAQRGETATPSPADLEALPDQQTAFLQYVVTPQRTYIFVLAHNIPVKVYIVPIRSEILASRVTGFRKMLADNALGFREPARQLHDLLLAPAARDLAGVRRIGLVPDGPLWELPFQALITGSNRYVLEDRAVFYVPSLSVLREMTSMKPTARGVLFAVGDPVAGTVSDDALAETGRMVDAIEQIYGSTNSRVLTGEVAQDETVKAESGHYQILHFATHGILDNDDPLYSRLLFAGSNGKADGYLEARELMRLDLHANLAVLSACETARGRVSEGEGLLGMSWALFVAGVPTTVVSQWKVDSASTSALMIGFHRLLKARLSPPEAAPANKAEVLRHPVASYHLLRSRGILEASKAEILRVAALQLMAKPEYRHPFYWAGFVVMGDGL